MSDQKKANPKEVGFFVFWWAPRESNSAPTDYESAALTKHELEARGDILARPAAAVAWWGCGVPQACVMARSRAWLIAVWAMAAGPVFP